MSISSDTDNIYIAALEAFVENLEFWLRPKNRNWFLGSALMVPQTNNVFTFDEKATIVVFKVKLFNMLNVLSCEYRDRVKEIERDLKIQGYLQQRAVHWAEQNKVSIIEEEENMKLYYIPYSRWNLAKGNKQ